MRTRILTLATFVTLVFTLGAAKIVAQGGNVPTDFYCPSSASRGQTINCTVVTGLQAKASTAIPLTVNIATNNESCWDYLPLAVGIPNGETTNDFNAIVAESAPLGLVRLTVSANGKSKHWWVEVQ